MNTLQKIKVVDLATLQLEKQRLKTICEVKKLKLDNELSYLKKNYPEVVMKTFLPFDDDTNKRVFQAAKWVNEKVAGLVENSNSKIGNLLSGKGANLLQTLVIYTMLRIGRNIFLKKK